MKTVSKNLIKLAIIMTALNDGGTAGAAPAMASIVTAFPNVSPFVVQSITTVPSLLIAFAPPIYAKLLDFTGKRLWLWIGALSFIIGGVAPGIFNENIWVILLFRALFGVGCGILTTMSTDLVVDFFEGKERNTMLGYVSASVGVSSVIFSILAGYLAGIKWEYSFFSYAISAFLLAVPIIFLPEPDRKSKIEAEVAAKIDTRLNLGTYMHMLIFLGFYICFYVFATNGAIVLVGEGLAVPAQIGVVFALLSAVACIMGILFGRIHKVLKFNMLPIGYFLGAIAFVIFNIAPTLATFAIGVGVLGLALGVTVPCTMAKLSSLVSYTASAKAIALGFFGMGIGAFLQPIIFSVFGANGIGRPPFIIGAIIFAVLAILVIVANKAFYSEIAKDSSESVAA